LDIQDSIENAAIRVGMTSLLSQISLMMVLCYKHALQLNSICKFWYLD